MLLFPGFLLLYYMHMLLTQTRIPVLYQSLFMARQRKVTI